MKAFDTKMNTMEKKALETNANPAFIYVGKVKDARSPYRDGSILVWITSSNTNENDPHNWILATSSSTYGIQKSITGSDEIYGETFNKPNVGDYVYIFYPYTGSYANNAVWFGSPHYLATSMLPGISYNLYESSTKTPICEMGNTKYSGTYLPLAIGLKLQGLDEDVLRGPSTASTIRDNPSRCYGFVSPMGNQLTIDDGWCAYDKRLDWNVDPRHNASNEESKGKEDFGAEYNTKSWIASLDITDKENKLNRFHGGFRFRTRNGTQLLILDSGNIYMINKDGSAWVELSDDGYIDCYSAKGINANSDGDVNLHSNANINIEGENVYIRGKNHIELESKGNIDLHTDCARASAILTAPKLETETITSLDVETEKATIKEGTFGGTLKGMAEYATSIVATVPVKFPEPSVDIELCVRPDEIEKNELRLKVNEDKVETINSRIPTHEPFEEHSKNDSIPDLNISMVLNKKEETKTTKESNKVSNTI